MVKLKDIKGVMVEEESYAGTVRGFAKHKGFNKAIEQQGSVSIGLTRERLIKFLNEVELETSNGEAFSLRFAISGHTQLLADSIIANLKDLLEVQHD